MPYLMKVFVVLMTGIFNTKGCPSVCRCTGNSIVNCVDKGLSLLPQGISTSVKELYLSQNSLGSDDLVKISEFGNLEVLDMAYNNIQMIKDRKLPKTLNTLILDHNQINWEGDDPFGNTEYTLVTLSLRNNKISREVSILTYYAHKKLEYLDLSFNEISSLSKNTVFPSSLRQLNLSNNPIKLIYPSTFRLTTQLKILDLTNIQKSSMTSRYFQTCSSLKQLYIGGQHLATISSITFNGLESLTKLVISDSKLTTLPTQVFAENPNLSVLDLSRNTFNEFEDDIFGNNTDLIEFYMTGNHGNLEIIARLFSQFRKIQYLSLSGNNITKFPSYLGRKLPKLKILDLSFNKIIELTTEYNFTSLIGINVSNNLISNVSNRVFSFFPALVGADFSRNKITKVKSNWFKYSLKELVTSGNVWSCDCDMKETLSNPKVTILCHAPHGFNISYIGKLDTNSDICIECSSPSKFEGNMYTNISGEIKDCDISSTDPPSTTALPTAIMIVIIAVVISFICFVIILVLVLRRHRREKPQAVEPGFDSPNCHIPNKNNAREIYQQIPEVGSGYTYAMKDVGTDHIYCSVREKPGANTCTRPYITRCKDTSTIRRSNLSVGSENAYVDDILPSRTYVNSRQYQATNTRQHRSSTDAAFQSLPPPPKPPGGVTGNLSKPQSAYEVEIGAHGRKGSYMDFNEPEEIAKKLNSQKSQNAPKSATNNNTYELEQ